MWTKQLRYYFIIKQRYYKIKSILILKYQHKSTQVNTSPTKLNMNQHEPNTSTTQVSKNEHESDTNQHESNTSQHKLGTSQHKSKTSLDHEKKNKYG